MRCVRKVVVTPLRYDRTDVRMLTWHVACSGAATIQVRIHQRSRRPQPSVNAVIVHLAHEVGEVGAKRRVRVGVLHDPHPRRFASRPLPLRGRGVR